MTQAPRIPKDLFSAHAKEIEAIFAEAVRRALLTHKRLGNPIAAWEDGKVVIIPAEEIEVDETPHDAGL
jgi:hypothetical protein